MRFFLSLKNWQVFIATFGLFPLAIAFTHVFSDFSYQYEWRGIDILLWALLVSQTICMIAATCWFYSVSAYLHKKYYYNGFVLALSRTGIYTSIVLTTLSFVIFPGVGYHDFAFISLTFVVYLVTLIYSSLLSARLLKMAELKKHVSATDFLKEFLGFIFYPIGVWWLQPRINKIFEKEFDEYDPNAPLDHTVKNNS